MEEFWWCLVWCAPLIFIIVRPPAVPAFSEYLPGYSCVLQGMAWPRHFLLCMLSHQPRAFAIGQSLKPKLPWYVQTENRIGQKYTRIITSGLYLAQVSFHWSNFSGNATEANCTNSHNLPTEAQKWNPHDSQIFKWSWELKVGSCAGAWAVLPSATVLRCRSTVPAVVASVAVPPPTGCKEWYSWASASDSKPCFVSTWNGGGDVACTCEATIFNAQGLDHLPSPSRDAIHVITDLQKLGSQQLHRWFCMAIQTQAQFAELSTEVLCGVTNSPCAALSDGLTKGFGTWFWCLFFGEVATLPTFFECILRGLLKPLNLHQKRTQINAMREFSGFRWVYIGSSSQSLPNLLRKKTSSSPKWSR